MWFWGFAVIQDGVCQTKRQMGVQMKKDGDCFEAWATVRLKSHLLRKQEMRKDLNACHSVSYSLSCTLFQHCGTWPFPHSPNCVKRVILLILDSCWGKWSSFKNGVMVCLRQKKNTKTSFSSYFILIQVYGLRGHRCHSGTALTLIALWFMTASSASANCPIGTCHHVTCRFDIYKELRKVLQISS